MPDANSPLFRFKMWQAGLPPTLRWLLTLNIALYVGFVLLSIVGQAGLLAPLTLPAQPAALAARPWSLLTYPFANLYGGFFGLLSFAFAMLWLNWLGRDYEESYGSYRLLGLAVFSILGGAALALALGAFGPAGGGLRGPAAPGIGYFGAWGIATGVLVGVATVHPNREMGLFLLGVVPLKWIAIGFVVLDLAFVRDPTHLGAAVAAFGFGRAQRAGVDLAAWARPIFERSPRKKKVPKASPAPRPSGGRSEAALRRVEAAELQRSGRPQEAGRPPRPPARPGPADVDRILDKILAEGYESLTAEEKRTLAEASRD